MFLTAVKGESSYRVAVMGTKVLAGDMLDNGRYAVLCTLSSDTKVEVGEFTVQDRVIGPFVERGAPQAPGKYRRVLATFLEHLESQMKEGLRQHVVAPSATQAQWCTFLHEAMLMLNEKILPYLKKLLEGMEDQYLALGYPKGESDLLEDVLRIEKIIATWEETFM